ncbi:MAG: GGDEF domain-containing protein, partial [Spirochaetota bacterium]
MGLKSEKVELLRKVDLFSQLREYELDIIADYSDFVSFKKGSAVFVQGSAADQLYVVEKGRIGIISIEDEGNDAVIAQITGEESFGELDFLGRTPRSASAFAEADSILLQFPSAGHKADEVFKEHAFIFARLLYTLLGTISERIWNVNKLLYDKTGWLYDLHKQLLCDKMTGLYNQAYLKEDFVNLLPDIGKGVALLMIKPDNFKDINDTCGHTAGDQALNLLAIFLQSELRAHDIGIRYRGDEYAAIMVDTDRKEAIEKAKSIGSAFGGIDLSGITGGSAFKIKVSIG